MNKLTPELQPWQTLAERGAHYVLCNPDKCAIAVAWQKKKPALRTVLAHARGGGLIGLVPASVGCVVIDIDEGGTAAAVAIKKSWAQAQSCGTKPSAQAVSIFGIGLPPAIATASGNCLLAAAMCGAQEATQSCGPR